MVLDLTPPGTLLAEITVTSSLFHDGEQIPLARGTLTGFFGH